MFCKKCGKLLMPKKKGKKKVMVCSSCGFSDEKVNTVIKEKMKKKKDIEIIDDEESESIHPIDEDSKCEKCGNKGAYFWEVQTRAGDEPATKFFKCTKCKHTWRDYS